MKIVEAESVETVKRERERELLFIQSGICLLYDAQMYLYKKKLQNIQSNKK